MSTAWLQTAVEQYAAELPRKARELPSMSRRYALKAIDRDVETLRRLLEAIIADEPIEPI